MTELGDHPRCGWAHPCFSNISSSSRHLTAIFLFLSWSAPPTMTGSFGRFLGKRSVRPLESGAPIILLSLCWQTGQSPFQPQWSHYWSGYRPVSWVQLRMRHTRHCSKQPMWVLWCVVLTRFKRKSFYIIFLLIVFFDLLLIAKQEYYQNHQRHGVYFVKSKKWNVNCSVPVVKDLKLNRRMLLSLESV